jgi:hypothetical protein
MVDAHYTSEKLQEMLDACALIRSKYQDLMMAFVAHPFSSAKAREFAANGFARRLGPMARAIRNIYTIVPPNRLDVPSRDENLDVTINLQAFLSNVYGAIDNLAWVLVEEKKILNPNGTPLRRSQVGLRRVNDVVRGALSADLRKHVESYDAWFEYIEDYRFALTHRIPPYVPPHCVAPASAEQYQDLERRKGDALQRLDFDEYDRLDADQERLVFFRPVMGHSPDEQTGVVAFHPQILADFHTVEELGWNVLDELRGKPFRVPFGVVADGEVKLA